MKNIISTTISEIEDGDDTFFILSIYYTISDVVYMFVKDYANKDIIQDVISSGNWEGYPI